MFCLISINGYTQKDLSEISMVKAKLKSKKIISEANSMEAYQTEFEVIKLYDSTFTVKATEIKNIVVIVRSKKLSKTFLEKNKSYLFSVGKETEFDKQNYQVNFKRKLQKKYKTQQLLWAWGETFMELKIE